LLAAASGDDPETSSKFEPKALYQEAGFLHSHLTLLLALSVADEQFSISQA
jgi:hypothetical protein